MSYKQLLLTGLFGMAAGAALFFWSRMPKHESPPDSPKPAVETEATPSAPDEGSGTRAQYPVAAENAEKPLARPSGKGENATTTDLNHLTFVDALSEVFGRDALATLFNLEDFVRRIVVTVENATNSQQLLPERSAFNPMDSEFKVAGKGKAISIAKDNYKRYAPYMDLLQGMEAKKLVAIYAHFYPQFQAAYRELGSEKYFNDEVVGMIDHILQTPDVPDLPRLVQPGPHYKYKFAAVELENLSASQKVLIRMGRANAQIVKNKLKEIRKLLVQLGKH